MIESELETALARLRYGRRPTADAHKGMWRTVSPATGMATARDR